MTSFADPDASAIIIIGGGLAGALLAARLLDRNPGQHVMVVEPAADLGRGAAYAPGHDLHQTNGPASLLSAIPDDPEHFVRWLQEIRATGLWSSEAPAQNVFAPRWLYGSYVGDILAKASRLADIPPTHMRDTATDLTPTPHGVRVTLASGRILYGSHAVLAMGVQFRQTAVQPTPTVVSPWNIEGLSRLGPKAKVAIIGAGLSMVDAVTSLSVAGHQGLICVFSRHGLRPHPRRLPQQWPEYLDDIPDSSTLRTIVARVVRECRTAVAQGADWQPALDRVRPHIRRWWHASPEAEQRRFLRHVRTLWETHHHRAPPDGQARVEAAFAEGRLTHLAATVLGVKGGPQSADVDYRPRGQSSTRRDTFDAVIVSSGVEYDWRRIATPLVANLFRRGLLRSGPLHLGIDAKADGRVIDAAGHAQDRILTLSHALRGLWWESTAIPDIARQAGEIAHLIGTAKPPHRTRPAASHPNLEPETPR